MFQGEGKKLGQVEWNTFATVEMILLHNVIVALAMLIIVFMSPVKLTLHASVSLSVSISISYPFTRHC